MTDLAAPLVDELDRLAPLEESDPDWRDVRSRARPSYRPAVAALAVVIAAMVPAVAFSSSLRSLLGFPSPIVAKSRVLVSAPIGNGFWVHSMSGPSSQHGWCEFSIVDRTRTVHPTDRAGAGGCSPRGTHLQLIATKARPLLVGIAIARRPKHGIAANWVPPSLTGVVARPLHVRRIVLTWSGGSHELTLNGWHFAGGTPALYLPKASAFPFQVVAYDVAGHVVATKKLERKTLELR